MGWLTPKYPKSDTPGASAAPAKRESRADRRHREKHEAIRTVMDQSRQNAVRASKERDAAFWEDYERRNGPGSVDWSGYRR